MKMGEIRANIAQTRADLKKVDDAISRALLGFNLLLVDLSSKGVTISLQAVQNIFVGKKDEINLEFVLVLGNVQRIRVMTLAIQVPFEPNQVCESVSKALSLELENRFSPLVMALASVSSGVQPAALITP